MTWLRIRFTRWDKDPFSYANAWKALRILARKIERKDWYASIRVEEFNVGCWRLSVGVRQGHHHLYDGLCKTLPWYIGPVAVMVHKAWNG